uniref:F-box domain-containing protein n=1 Tax=Haptolina brevifila TaxID=156173 RepID=A0A7S2N2V7_9EUKA|mmetsp:Transcript_65102/g.128745  ORF Transcript_65102/g.128745 Transcript_65102/m.128745 type:complete len:471 (+) Transcript_65102:124-1536(+)
MATSRLAFDFPSWKFGGGGHEAASAPSPKASATSDASSSQNDRASLLMDLEDLDDEGHDRSATPATPAAAPLVPSSKQASGTPTPATPTAAPFVPTSKRTSSTCGVKCWTDDVLFAVLSHLTSVQLCTARCVALQWLDAASCDSLWAAAWRANLRFSRRPPRLPCGAKAFSSPSSRHSRLFEYATRCRADHLYRWMDLQCGWDRLEALLAPEQLGVALRAGSRANNIDQVPVARKLSSILAARDWMLLHRCVLLLLMECAEQVARSLLSISVLEPSTSRLPEQASEIADEQLLLQALIEKWHAYSRWLSHVCGTFAHHAGTTCRTHLICLLAAERSNERIDQHTPSLLHAGFSAFRQSVLCHPRITAALQRHVQRATSSVMAQGGFTAESGRLMQELLDLQDLCTTVDVRDDHLCEERGERFTQEALRESLIGPIKKCWLRYHQSWFCGTKIPSSDLAFYQSSKHRRRGR